jgi:hypothetical protein
MNDRFLKAGQDIEPLSSFGYRLCFSALYRNPIQHNVFWIAYAGVAALLGFITKGRLGYWDRTC